MKYVLRKRIKCSQPLDICKNTINAGYILPGWGPYTDINVAYKSAADLNEAYSVKCECRCEVEETGI